MSSQVIYAMHGFNVPKVDSSYQRIVKLKNNFEYHFKNHSFLESFSIDEDFKKIKFTLLPGKEAKDYMNQIGDELEKICFNIIAYSEVPTHQPLCTLELITNEMETEIEIRDSIQLRECIKICDEMEAVDLYESIMDRNTPLSSNKAKYKELFYILHNPHEVIQFIALYDVLMNLICSSNERNKQKRVRDFFGKNRERYPFIQFHKCNDNSEKSEDTFTHLRNNIAHSKEAGINDFLETSNSITNKHVSDILRVINDIISGEVKVD